MRARIPNFEKPAKGYALLGGAGSVRFCDGKGEAVYDSWPELYTAPSFVSQNRTLRPSLKCFGLWSSSCASGWSSFSFPEPLSSKYAFNTPRSSVGSFKTASRTSFQFNTTPQRYAAGMSALSRTRRMATIRRCCSLRSNSLMNDGRLNGGSLRRPRSI